MRTCVHVSGVHSCSCNNVYAHVCVRWCSVMHVCYFILPYSFIRHVVKCITAAVKIAEYYYVARHGLINRRLICAIFFFPHWFQFVDKKIILLRILGSFDHYNDGAFQILSRATSRATIFKCVALIPSQR